MLIEQKLAAVSWPDVGVVGGVRVVLNLEGHHQQGPPDAGSTVCITVFHFVCELYSFRLICSSQTASESYHDHTSNPPKYEIMQNVSVSLSRVTSPTAAGVPGGAAGSAGDAAGGPAANPPKHGAT